MPAARQVDRSARSANSGATARAPFNVRAAMAVKGNIGAQRDAEGAKISRKLRAGRGVLGGL